MRGGKGDLQKRGRRGEERKPMNDIFSDVVFMSVQLCVLVMAPAPNLSWVCFGKCFMLSVDCFLMSLFSSIHSEEQFGE